MSKTYYIVKKLSPWTDAFECVHPPLRVSINGFGFGFLPVFETEDQALEYLGDPDAKEMVFKMQEVERERG